jgi:hypothetical protein
MLQLVSRLPLAPASFAALLSFQAGLSAQPTHPDPTTQAISAPPPTTGLLFWHIFQFILYRTIGWLLILKAKIITLFSWNLLLPFKEMY